MSIRDGKSRGDKTFRLLTRGLTPKEASVYNMIFETWWDLGGTFLSTVPYDEVILRSIFKFQPHGTRLKKELKTKEGNEEYSKSIEHLLEKEGKEIKDTIDELCAKGFVKCETIRFGDGVLEKMTEPTKVLIMRDYDRRILMHDTDGEFLREDWKRFFR